MIGVRGVRGLLVAALTDHIPAKITEIRTRENLPPKSFPRPLRVIPHEPGRKGIDQFPVLALMPYSTDTENGPVRSHSDGLGDTYQYRYRLWIYGFTAGPSAAAADTQRDLLALALREVLLQHRGLSQTVVLDPNTIVESYSEVDQEQNGDLVAGFRFTVEYMAEENLASRVSPVGVATPPQVGIGVTP